jgi:hypothetical protein
MSATAPSASAPLLPPCYRVAPANQRNTAKRPAGWLTPRRDLESGTWNGGAGRGRFHFRLGPPVAKRTLPQDLQMIGTVWQRMAYGGCAAQERGRGCQGSRNECSQGHENAGLAPPRSFRCRFVSAVAGGTQAALLGEWTPVRRTDLPPAGSRRAARPVGLLFLLLSARRPAYTAGWRSPTRDR